ncbi:ABC transporter permease [Kushneria phosphatilytica]|uniref:ABC transporter permease n=1 Tax=Kushneria phosphatilytica TaxID=657387 RepID=UPI0008D92DDB|nr:ABC transporter permease [Kushneria phosphatilytica]OHV10036.1 hypothetical protein BH688_10550 [Kushneria phosphatilytica]
MPRLINILQLGIKELHSLWRDPVLLLLIGYAFTLSIYASAHGIAEVPHRASIGVVDEDRSQVSQRLLDAFRLPWFLPPERIDPARMDSGLDNGTYIFALDIPPDFQQKLLRGNQPTIQLNVDATQVSKAFSGAAYIQQILTTEAETFLQRYRQEATPAVRAVIRNEFNPNLTRSWFGAVNEIVNQLTMLALILSGAALIREREHGTLEHLLVMPVTPLEIMLAKVTSMGMVVLAAALLSLKLIVAGWLEVPLRGSLMLFTAGAMLLLFAMTSLGILLGTIARSMPQLGILVILVLIPLRILSGGETPRESMPTAIQDIMLLAPTTQFIELAQAVLFRGAGLDIIWPRLFALALLGALFFGSALVRLRRSLA